MPLLAEGQGHRRESNPSEGTKYVQVVREKDSRSCIPWMHAEERSPARGRETRNKEEIPKSERLQRDRQTERKGERERKMVNRPESSERN